MTNQQLKEYAKEVPFVKIADSITAEELIATSYRGGVIILSSRTIDIVHKEIYLVLNTNLFASMTGKVAPDIYQAFSFNREGRPSFKPTVSSLQKFITSKYVDSGFTQWFIDIVANYGFPNNIVTLALAFAIHNDRKNISWCTTSLLSIITSIILYKKSRNIHISSYNDVLVITKETIWESPKATIVI